jgi:hypothetical protein
MCTVRQSLATRIKRFAQRSGYRRALVSGASGCNVLPLPADVAQLVEQRFRKPQVTGSNPVVGSSVRFHRGFCVAQLQDYGLAGRRLRLLCVRSSNVER